MNLWSYLLVPENWTGRAGSSICCSQHLAYTAARWRWPR